MKLSLIHIYGSISVNAQLLSPAFFENITPDSEVSEAVSELLEPVSYTHLDVYKRQI